MKNVMMVVPGGLRRERDGGEVCAGQGVCTTLSYIAFTDIESTIASKEVGRVGDESNVVDSIRVVVFDTRLLRESRQMEIDFLNQLDVYWKRRWALSRPVIPRRVNERYSRLRRMDDFRREFVDGNA